MKIVITGATGFIGSALVNRLKLVGHEVLTISRKLDPAVIHWDLNKQELDTSQLEGVDVLVHLAGESVAQRWTPAVRKRILESREKSSKLLVDKLLNELKQPPRDVFVASGVGYYGSDVDEPVTESSALGSDFLAEVCQAWESAWEPLDAVGVRRVHMRTSLVLSPTGGALAKMLPAFKMGLGGPLGSGEQWTSWISLSDWIAAFEFCLQEREISGPVNFSSPKPVTNQVFTKTLGAALKRPAFFKAPRFVLKTAFGEMADATLLSNLNVVPQKLLGYGFQFEHKKIEQAWAALL